jgi:hypothetical protein
MTHLELITEFEKDFSHLKRFGMRIDGTGHRWSPELEEDLPFINDWDEVDPEAVTITVFHPFIFDSRQLPEKYKGVEIRKGHYSNDGMVPIAHPMYFPLEFDYCGDMHELWDPQRYFTFVDRCENDIREILENPGLTKKEMLDLLTGGDFQKHIEQCEEWEDIFVAEYGENWKFYLGDVTLPDQPDSPAQDSTP